MFPGIARFHSRYAVAAVLLLAAAVLLAGDTVLSYPSFTPVRQAPGVAGDHFPRVYETAPQLLKPLTAEEAAVANAAQPFVEHGLERPPSFLVDGSDGGPISRRAALDCLTAAIYYEAGGESEQGQRAVAQVVLNRVRHPAFPASICEVVYQGSERTTGCQFSFTCDGSLARQPSRYGWERARRIAERALAGSVEPAVGMATHYHANSVAPYWAPELDKIAKVGAHLFYRWHGHWGLRQSFTQHYSGEAAAEARLAYAQDLIGEYSDRKADLLAVPPPEDRLPGSSKLDLGAPLITAPQPKLVADEPETRLAVDEKKFVLVDEGRASPGT